MKLVSSCAKPDRELERRAAVKSLFMFKVLP
jgi:hypothetical protein